MCSCNWFSNYFLNFKAAMFWYNFLPFSSQVECRFFGSQFTTDPPHNLVVRLQLSTRGRCETKCCIFKTRKNEIPLTPRTSSHLVLPWLCERMGWVRWYAWPEFISWRALIMSSSFCKVWSYSHLRGWFVIMVAHLSPIESNWNRNGTLFCT